MSRYEDKMRDKAAIILESFKTDYTSFYEHYSNADFSELTKERVEYLKSQREALILDIKRSKYKDVELYSKNYGNNIVNIFEYKLYLNKIKTSSYLYGTLNDAEDLALFAFAVDPEFDAYVIQKTANTTKEAEKQLTERFGFYDPNLIKIETRIYSKLSVREKHKLKIKVDQKAFN